jgi:hypothetical protein
MTMDNSPHVFESEKSGQFICYKTGQVYLLLTGIYCNRYILQHKITVREYLFIKATERPHCSRTGTFQRAVSSCGSNWTNVDAFFLPLEPLDVGKVNSAISELIGARSMEIIFTSCATESNNTAINAALKANPRKRQIVTSAVEHSSVLNYCKAIET